MAYYPVDQVVIRITKNELAIIAVMQVSTYCDARLPQPQGSYNQPARDDWAAQRDLWAQLPATSRYTILTNAKKLLILRMGWPREYLEVTEAIYPNQGVQFPDRLLETACQCFRECLNTEIFEPTHYPKHLPAPQFTSFSEMSAYDQSLSRERSRARSRAIECEVYRALQVFDVPYNHALFPKWISCSGTQRFYIIRMAMESAWNWAPDFQSTNNLRVPRDRRAELRKDIVKEVMRRVDMFPHISSASNSPSASQNNSPYGYYHQ